MRSIRRRRSRSSAKDVRYFYVTIPSQPNVKLKYDPSAPGAIEGLPVDGRSGRCRPRTRRRPSASRSLVQDGQGGKQRKGQFVQMPVASAMLTIATIAPPVFSPGVNAGAQAPRRDAGRGALRRHASTARARRARRRGRRLHADERVQARRAVRRSAPGAPSSRRATSSRATTSRRRTSRSPASPTSSSTGARTAQPANQVFFWTNAWIIPATFPLGETTVHVVFTLESGKTGAYDHDHQLIP